MTRIPCAVAISVLLVPAAFAQRATAPGDHPDLNGTWAISLGVNAGSALRREAGGSEEIRRLDGAAIRGAVGKGRGALPWTSAPSYKPEIQAKVKDLDTRQSRTDPVFYCGRPGVPRVGPPRRIIQLPDEVVFLYEDMSGDP